MEGDEPQVASTTDGDETPLSPLVSFAVILLLVAANYGVFRLFDGNYFRWYLDHGGVIALAVSLVALVVELDNEPTLVAAHPGSYVAGWFALIGETTLYLAGLVGNRAVGFLDSIGTVLYSVVFVPLAFAWLAVVAPLQYFVTLVTGAPARSAAVSPRMWVQRSGKTIVLRRGPANEMPEATEEIGLAQRPVTVTNSITAGALFVVSMLT